jgi:hypothetical protein
VSQLTNVQEFRNRLAERVYLLLGAVGLFSGLVWGIFVSKLDPVLALVGALGFTLFFLAIIGQRLFVRVRIDPREVVFYSPFRRSHVLRERVVSVEVWEATPDEGRKSILHQSAGLVMKLSDGRTVGITGLDVGVLKQIRDAVR